MNQALIATIIATLLIGIIAGSVIQRNRTPEQNQVHSAEQTYIIAAEDFVAVRPEIAALPEQELSEAELAGLMLMREEEKLARDVYQRLYDTYRMPIFQNIAQSEQTHTEAVRDLIEKYGLEDPVTDDTMGVFRSPDIQNLYNELVTEGIQGENKALQVGATIEDLDIKDLEDLLAQTDNEDIILVYENLQRGSRNHLRAFVGQIESRGLTYKPKYILEETYQSIIGSEQERGSGATGKQSRGWGNNSGRNQ